MLTYVARFREKFSLSLSDYLVMGYVAMSLTFLAVTLLRSEIRDLHGLVRHIDKLNLTSENTVGTWFSGILLLLVALHAFDGYMSLRKRHSRGAMGWALLSVVLLLLSADEIGSIHERISGSGIVPRVPVLVAFGIILSPLLGYGLMRLWSEKDQRRSALVVAAAFALLSTVAFQEFIEHRIEWGGLAGLRGAVEEGTELLAMLILLKVAMSNTQGRFARRPMLTFPTLEAVVLARPYILFVGLMMAPILAYLTANLSDQQRGHPADWLTMTIFMLAALTASRSFYKHGEKIGPTALALTGVCLLGSLISVVVEPDYDAHIAVAKINLRMAALFVVSIIVCATWIPSFKYATHWAAWLKVAAPIAAMASLGLLGLFQTRLYYLYFVPQLMALLTYYGNFAVVRRPEPPTPR